MSQPRSLRRLLPPALLLAPVLALYARTLGRYFVSEDFLILRLLTQGSWWHTVASQFTSPWLGLEMFRFYRPVATLLLAVEAALFGAHPLPYLLVHLLVHGLNVLLAYRCAARMLPAESPVLPWCAALLFGLYPLHPNAVVFIASFATLFAASFVLASLLAFLELRERGGRGPWLLSVLGYALALGCYEGALVLPGLLAGFDLLAPARGAAATLGWRRRLLHHAPFVAVAGLYLLGRRLLFGVVLGGYEHISQRLRAWPVPLLEDLLDSFRRLPWPFYETSAATGWGVFGTSVALALLLLAVIFALAARLDGRERTFSTLVLVAAGWVVLSQAPFAFARVVPGNGRYWYLTALGLALGTVAAAGLGARLMRRSPVPATVLATAALTAAWVPLLWLNLGRHAEAGKLTRELQAQVLALGTSPDGGAIGEGGPWFIAGYPQFVTTGDGSPAAQVFHWGLSDALRPPFVPRPVATYPLPSAETATFLSLLRSPLGSRVRVWQPEAHRLVPASPPATPPLAGIPVHGLPDGAVLAADGSDWQLEIEAPQTWQLTLTVLAPGNVRREPLPAGAGRRQVPLPADFLRLMATLYGDEAMVWWLEARDGGGQLVAASPPARWRVGARPPGAARR